MLVFLRQSSFFYIFIAGFAVMAFENVEKCMLPHSLQGHLSEDVLDVPGTNMFKFSLWSYVCILDIWL